ncbi:MAG: hypothetical protein K9W42_04090 [Candidatus Heimdallarchaeota archaeon]|nr:hypothetical protein [Candidatus Heimdallarchaeota archaeon]
MQDKKFIEFLNKIRLKEEELEVAKKWTNGIKQALDKQPFIDKVVLSGSLKRKTAISPIHDVDLYTVFKRGYKTNNSKKMAESLSELMHAEFSEELKSIKIFDHGTEIRF